MEPRFPAHLFAGTIDDYVRHRIPYPEPLIRDLLARVSAAGNGMLVDLGCGPGRLTFRLAPHFARVVACDLEPGMIAAAKAESERRGFRHIQWEAGLAETLEIPAGSVDLVTVGEAFHRLNQEVVVPLISRWLRPGGALATAGSYVLADRSLPWQRAVLEVVDALVRPTGNATNPPSALMGPEHDEGIFRAAGFTEVASHPFLLNHVWTAEGIIGYLHSTSFASRARLGPKTDAFDEAVRRALEPFLVDGGITDTIQFGYTFARWPESRVSRDK
ncbi:MAG TPA: methyltransferase domain-containing protein [Candidatus Didemnitutus sp.]|jgi:SAM-dependent methyltransferase